MKIIFEINQKNTADLFLCNDRDTVYIFDNLKVCVSRLLWQFPKDSQKGAGYSKTFQWWDGVWFEKFCERIDKNQSNWDISTRKRAVRIKDIKIFKLHAISGKFSGDIL